MCLHTQESRDEASSVKEPLISVIVPVYKTEKYLDRCISSIVSQTYRNLEIILVDDGSPDRCGEMCDEWAKKDTRIKVIHKENGGAADAKNAALSVMKGEFFGIIDSDDIIAPDMYEALYGLICRYGADIADSQICTVDSYEEADKYKRPDEKVFVYTASDALSELISDRTIRQTPCNKLYRSGIANEIFFPKGRYIDDEYWTYRVIGNCGKYSFTNVSYYFYLQHGESAMGKSYSLRRLDAVDAMLERYEYVKEKFPELEAKALASYVGTCRYHYQMISYHSELDKDRSERKKLYDRVKTSDIGTVRKSLKGKKRVWFEAFLACPEFTSKIRNRFKIGW